MSDPMSDEKQPLPGSLTVHRVVHLEPDPSVLSAIGRGHSLHSAIADIVDNSIDHAATRIAIRFMVQQGHVRSIRIADDGTGMTETKLLEAMTIGKRRAYDPGDLGHFGMGLKAASMSQGRRLEVFTSCGSEPIRGVRMHRDDAGGGFDVELLTETAAWQGYHRGTHRGIESTGTVVEWSMLDAVSTAAEPSARQRWLDAQITDLRGHLGLTFHRLISSGRARIEIDEFDMDYDEAGAPRAVVALDPFEFHHSGRSGYPKTIHAELSNGAQVPVTCHVLPPNSSAPAARLRGKSRRDWQGLYVYRNDRLLQAGGWLGLLDDHRSETQLARAAIDIDESALGAVAINPEKRGVILRAEFTHALERAAAEDGTTFRGYLADAVSTLQHAHTRRAGLKPVTPIGAGLSDDAREAVISILGAREEVPAASIRWKALEPDRLFRFDHSSRTLWMNAGYRATLGAADGLALSIYLLLEGHFAKDRVHESTLDQIEAWQRALALTTLSTIGARAYDPEGYESGRDEELDVFNTVGPSVSRGLDDGVPSPASLARSIADRRARDAAAEALEAARKEVHERDRSERYARDAARGELTDDGERMERLAGVPGATADLVADFRIKLDRYPLLTAEEEISLARSIEAGVIAQERLAALSDAELKSQHGRELAEIAARGEAAVDRFVGSNMRLVMAIAGKYTRGGLEYADLLQEGALGLIRAIEKFDHTRGLKFSTYATWWVRQNISRALADRGSLIRIPVHMVEQQSRVRAAIRKLELLGEGEEPSVAQIAATAGLSGSEVEAALKYHYGYASLDHDISVYGDGGATLADVLTDEGASEPIEAVIGAEFLGVLDTVLNDLPDRDSAVIRRRFGLDGMPPATLDQIGDEFGVTRERIRQIEKQRLTQLRESPAIRAKLRDFLDEDFERLRLHTLEPFVSRGRPPRNRPEGPRSTSTEQAARMSAGEVPHPEPPLQPIPIEVTAEVGSDVHIVELYRDRTPLTGIESETGLDIRIVVERLARVVLDQTGDIDDESLAPRHGLPWDPSERERTVDAFRSGVPVERIAHDHGRTPLAICWQLLDSPRHPVAVPRKLLRRLRRDPSSNVRRADEQAG